MAVLAKKLQPAKTAALEEMEPLVMDAAYATLSSPNSLDFSGDENIKAYTASNLRGTNVYLNQVSDVPAATGIVIHGTAGTEYVVGLGTGAPLKEQNLLVAVTDTVTLSPLEGMSPISYFKSSYVSLNLVASFSPSNLATSSYLRSARSIHDIMSPVAICLIPLKSASSKQSEWEM